MNYPKLTLVGAGPGDPDLITLKGIRALEAADVVLYDALVDPILLDYAQKAKKHFVGKRKGNHTYTQSEINSLIVSYAFSDGHVVRLKGGDPFVFGRGGEEIAHAKAFGIDAEVVPGISSVTSVPARKGISLTHRGVSESFWVVTGTTSGNQLSNDLKLAAQSTATVVILMGMGKLPEIVRLFKQFGKVKLPIAIIQNGFLPSESSAIGHVNNIEEIVAKRGLSNPAIIVVGDVVKESHKLSGIFDEAEAYYLNQP